MPYFKKYQLTELDVDKDSYIFAAENFGETAQALIEGEDEMEAVTLKRLELIESVKQNFNTHLSVNDLAILYEITGF